MSLIFKRNLLVIVAALAFIFGSTGCAKVEGNNLPDRTAAPDLGEGGGEAAYQTATPPADPDLRGSEFQIILFITEIEQYSYLVESIERSVMDAVDHFNATGGVNGAELALRTFILPDDPEAAVGQFVSALDRNNPVTVLFAAPLNDTIYYEINQQEVPLIYFGFGGDHPVEPEKVDDNVFWIVPYPEVQLGAYFSQVWRNWEEVRPSGTHNELVIGYLGDDEDSPVLNIDRTLAELQASGFEIALIDRVSSSPNGSATNFIISAVQYKVTAIYSDSSSTGTSVLLNDLDSLALNQVFMTGGQIWSVDQGMDDFLLRKESLEGFMLPLPVHWWSDDENPGIQLAIEIFDRYADPDSTQDLAYLLGLASVDLTVEVLRRAVSEENFTFPGGEEANSQLTHLDDYPVMGGLFVVDYTEGNRAPSEIHLWRFHDGELVPVGE